MKEKLVIIKAALEHAIRVMEEEIYVTRDQDRAVVLVNEIISDIDAKEKRDKKLFESTRNHPYITQGYGDM